ncbi:hypothetical protein ENUP19_0082G0082 [Entamoeba nuttalli]|uniref:Tyrosine kinase, putative n=2 Tax=Entamoeba nuttalli TaxID=412467 RepID=K2GGP0_ENTNP|nr:tyrosine kinase, putative [Entamoeba nuttalli P19]EKE41936.1 tyrosine kinase, putative [Entamoeba nuttalli P19]|eukprot:XP_008855737.1 tyrosine kinase, putative [Entamoeba nuttalli P19]
MLLFVAFFLFISTCIGGCWMSQEDLWIDDSNYNWDSYCNDLGINLVNNVIDVNSPKVPNIFTQNLNRDLLIAPIQGYNVTKFLITKWSLTTNSIPTITFNQSYSKTDVQILFRRYDDVFALGHEGFNFILKDTNSYFVIINENEKPDNKFDIYLPFYLQEPKPLLTVTIHKMHIIPSSYVQKDLRCIFYSSASSEITEDILYLNDSNLLESRVNCFSFTKRYICHNSSLSYNDSKCIVNVDDTIDRGHYSLNIIYDYIITGLTENIIEQDLIVNNYNFDGIDTFVLIGTGHNLTIMTFQNKMKTITFKGNGVFNIQKFYTKFGNWEKILSKESSQLTIGSLVNNGTGILEQINPSIFVINTFENIYGDTTVIGTISFKELIIKSAVIKGFTMTSGIINLQNNIQADGYFDLFSSIIIVDSFQINTLPPLTLIGKNKQYQLILSSVQSSNCVDLISTIPSSSFSMNETEHIKLLSNNRLIRYCPSSFNYSVQCIMNSTLFDLNYHSPSLFTLPHCPCSGNSCIIVTKEGIENIDFHGEEFDFILKVSNPVFSINNILSLYSLDINTDSSIITITSNFTLTSINSNIKIINEAGQFTFTGTNIGEVDVKSSFKVTNTQVTIEKIHNCDKHLVIGKDVLYLNIKEFGCGIISEMIIETEDSSSILTIQLPEGNKGLVTIFSRRPMKLEANENKIILISESKTSYSINILRISEAVIICHNHITLKTVNSNEDGEYSLNFHSEGSCQVYIINGGVSKCAICEYNNFHFDLETKKCIKIMPIEHCTNSYNGYCKTCEEGYYVSNNLISCLHCSDKNARVCWNDDSIACTDNYTLSHRKCVISSIDNCLLFHNEKCMRCSNGKYQTNLMTCEACDLTCSHCYYNKKYNNSVCDMCYNSTSRQNDYQCYKDEHAIVTVNSGILECDIGYYPNENKCVECSLLFGNCEICNTTNCLKCKNNNVLDINGKCRYSNKCKSISWNKCITCVNNEDFNNGTDCISNYHEDCYAYNTNGECIACKTKLLVNGVCGGTILGCKTFYNEFCLRCEDGLYLNNNTCNKCDPKCKTCIGSSVQCIECSSIGYFINSTTHYCEYNSNLKDVCLQYTVDGGCVKCANQWYAVGFNCLKCNSSCLSCRNLDMCNECIDNYFFDTSNNCVSNNIITNCDSVINKWNGCTKCKDGYFVKDKMCSPCSSGCQICTEPNKCLTCKEKYVYSIGQCIIYSQISNCKEAKNSKCLKCSGWNKPNKQGNACLRYIPARFIVGIIVLVIVLLISVLLGVYLLSKWLLKYLKLRDIEKQLNIFSIAKSNLSFISFGSVLVNKTVIDFVNEDIIEIPVNEKSIDTIVIGNLGKSPIKILFSLKEGTNDKFTLETNPSNLIIRKGVACPFKICIIPKCSCFIEEDLIIMVHELKTGKNQCINLRLIVKTQISTILDYDEVKEEEKIGEGGFGIVFKGKFRGNEVAIKKMKQVENKESSMFEFLKEVEMLDKFRSEYIVHFYGAVLIPTKVCMVTEFAKYGSVNDYKKKYKEKPFNRKLKIKVLIDAAKGISYLHNNGIIHRDIKPDNLLLFSLEYPATINAKLTDFGSSRNINMMMTNMTFTKAVGTPIFMAPEILNRKHYKMPADIYSFAITMLEIITWKDSFPKELYPHPWDIANTVTSGKRPVLINEVEDSIKEIIEQSWKQEPKERIRIDDIIMMLEKEIYPLN